MYYARAYSKTSMDEHIFLSFKRDIMKSESLDFFVRDQDRYFL